MTVDCHADGLKISHVEPDEATRLINYLGNIYGEMVAQRGKQLNYLGMELYYSNKG